jgi:hypothetical protein
MLAHHATPLVHLPFFSELTRKHPSALAGGGDLTGVPAFAPPGFPLDEPVPPAGEPVPPAGDPVPPAGEPVFEPGFPEPASDFGMGRQLLSKILGYF